MYLVLRTTVLVNYFTVYNVHLLTSPHGGRAALTSYNRNTCFGTAVGLQLKFGSSRKARLRLWLVLQVQHQNIHCVGFSCWMSVVRTNAPLMSHDTLNAVVCWAAKVRELCETGHMHSSTYTISQTQGQRSLGPQPYQISSTNDRHHERQAAT